MRVAENGRLYPSSSAVPLLPRTVSANIGVGTDPATRPILRLARFYSACQTARVPEDRPRSPAKLSRVQIAALAAQILGVLTAVSDVPLDTSAPCAIR
jgi:hypothetical protein